MRRPSLNVDIQKSIDDLLLSKQDINFVLTMMENTDTDTEMYLDDVLSTTSESMDRLKHISDYISSIDDYASDLEDRIQQLEDRIQELENGEWV